MASKTNYIIWQSHLISTWYLAYRDWFDICDIFLFDIFRNKQNRQKMEKKTVKEAFLTNLYVISSKSLMKHLIKRKCSYTYENW